MSQQMGGGLISFSAHFFQNDRLSLYINIHQEERSNISIRKYIVYIDTLYTIDDFPICTDIHAEEP